MAFFRQPCIHCGTFIEGDARVCPGCGSRSPFGALCPACLRPIQKGQALCDSCGRSLYTICPFCGRETFVGQACTACGQSLMVRCANKRCGAEQFFENTKCTACGKKIKNKLGR